MDWQPHGAEPVPRRLLVRFALLLALGGLAACTSARAPVIVAPPPTPQPSAPSAPLPEAPDFVQTGLASYYGMAHQGKVTADGEHFDIHAMTAAHRTLPFQTVVRVTAPATGKTVKVRINDRGPFIAGRIIDLSDAAAKELGIAGSGTAQVVVQEFASDQPPR
jgi:rare lipoprotein A